MVLFDAFDLTRRYEPSEGYSGQKHLEMDEYLINILELLSEQTCELKRISEVIDERLLLLNRTLSRIYSDGVGP